MNPEEQLKASQASRWADAHGVSLALRLQMADILEKAPIGYLNRPVDSILRWAYTQALQERHHGR